MPFGFQHRISSSSDIDYSISLLYFVAVQMYPAVTHSQTYLYIYDDSQTYQALC